MSKSKPIVTTVRCCARCGGDHESRVFTPFARPCDDMTHWALCPETEAPILLKVVDDDEPELSEANLVHDMYDSLCRRITEEGRGVAMIAAERRRQQEVEGYTAVHDDEHVLDELLEAAACYLCCNRERSAGDFSSETDDPPPAWPFELEAWKPAHHSSDIKNLVRAGALIAAEIDRIVRERVREEQ